MIGMPVVDAPIKVAEQRNTKCLYAKARAGALPNFTGINSPYEAPENPDLVVDTSDSSIETSVQLLRQALSARGCCDQH